jgi:hypothetical protein
MSSNRSSNYERLEDICFCVCAILDRYRFFCKACVAAFLCKQGWETIQQAH